MNTSAKPFRVEWRRSEVNSTFIASLTKSDRAAWIQTCGHIFLFALTGGGVILTAESQLWPAFAAALIAHGVVASFLTNGIHELSHGTVFESAGLSRLFLNVFCYIRWINPHAFWAGHSRHHRYTLYPPYDREVVLPAQLSLIDFLRRALIDPLTMIERVRLHVEYACGIFRSDWDREILQLGPASSKVAQWSRGMLLAHGLAAAVLLSAGAWPAFVAISLTPAYGGFLFYLCNNTQHAGMKSQTPDFRESCRTIYLSPALEFLYWRMNYHAEHHMYPNVPCYRLRSLHDAVRGDLPPATRGLVEAWRAIAASAHPAASNSQ